MFALPLKVTPPDFARLASLILLPDTEPMTMRGRREGLDQHLAELRLEFAGGSELAYYHAVLIVLVRRGVEADLAFRHFEQAWNEQHVHLLSSLSARWLVAACDTLMTNAPDRSERAIACIASTLLGTVKLYETERLAMRGPEPARLRELAHTVELFDGMTSFSVGHGDMIINLRERTKAICDRPTTASRIVLELLNRVDRADTVFRRFSEAHVEPRTQWVMPRG